MIRREDIRELAEFFSGEGCALSFYFQPRTPQNKSHHEEVILAKDLVKAALGEAEKNGKKRSTRADLDRILQLAENLHGNQAHAKAVFACSAKNFWREFDLPPQLTGSSLSLNRRFHLRPLAPVLGNLSSACVVLVDRQRARLFEVTPNEVREREDIIEKLPRRGRSDGFGGYDAGHAERHVENEAIRHFKHVAERLKELHEARTCQSLIVGTRDETWPEFEAQLHPYVRQHVLGRFAIDAASATAEQVRQEASRILAEAQANRREGLIREVAGEAQRNGRGAVGLRRVLRSLETGEIQTLLLGDKFQSPGVECTNCGHLDYHLTQSCAVCGQPTRELIDIADALIATAVRNGIEVLYIEQNPELEKLGHIAALLRFRADQSTNDLKQAG